MTNGDPANGWGSEFGSLQRLTGSGELMQYAFADGSGSEPQSYETLSYAGGFKRFKNNLHKNQKARQKQQSKDSTNNASAIKALNKLNSQPNIILPPLPKEKATGLSTGAKVGIAVGVAALIGIGIYMYKHKK